MAGKQGPCHRRFASFPNSEDPTAFRRVGGGSNRPSPFPRKRASTQLARRAPGRQSRPPTPSISARGPRQEPACIRGTRASGAEIGSWMCRVFRDSQAPSQPLRHKSQPTLRFWAWPLCQDPQLDTMERRGTHRVPDRSTPLETLLREEAVEGRPPDAQDLGRLGFVAACLA